MIPAILLFCPSMDSRDHRRELARVDTFSHPGQICVFVIRLAIQCCIVTSMVTDLVEHGPAKEVASRYRFLAICPSRLSPRQPIAALGIGGEQKHLPALS